MDAKVIRDLQKMVALNRPEEVISHLLEKQVPEHREAELYRISALLRELRQEQTRGIVSAAAARHREKAIDLQLEDLLWKLQCSREPTARLSRLVKRLWGRLLRPFRYP